MDLSAHGSFEHHQSLHAPTRTSCWSVKGAAAAVAATNDQLLRARRTRRAVATVIDSADGDATRTSQSHAPWRERVMRHQWSDA